MADPGTPATNYKVDQIDVLYDLIERSNPGFTAQYPKGSVQFTTVTAVSVIPGDPYKNDTSVLVSAAPGSSALGRQTVRYRRLDLPTIFRNMKLTLNDYSAGTTLPVATWKASLVQKFGVNIPAADISNTAALTTGSLTNVSVIAGSLCYKGTVQVTWTKGPRPFPSLITDANRALVGRLYPDGNDFTTPGRKPQGEFMAYCQDASIIGSIIEPLVNGQQPDASPIKAAVVNWLLENTERTDWNGGSSNSGTGGLSSTFWYKYTLPNAAIPEANSAKYNRCLVIQGTALSWFAGKIIIHYKV